MLQKIKNKGINFFFSNNLITNLISSYTNAILNFIYNSVVLYILSPQQWGYITSILVFKDLALNINIGETEYLRKNFLHQKSKALLKKTFKISLLTILVYTICFTTILVFNIWEHIGIKEVFFLFFIFCFDYLQYTPNNLSKSIGNFHALKIAYLVIPLINILTLPLVYFFTVNGFFVSKILSSFIALILLFNLVKKKVRFEDDNNSLIKELSVKEIISTSSVLQFINIGLFLINGIPKFILPTQGNFGITELGYLSFAFMLMMPFNQFISISNEIFFNKSNKSILENNSINLKGEIKNFSQKLTALFLLYPLAEALIMHFFFKHYKRDFLYFFNVVAANYFQGYILIAISMTITRLNKNKLFIILGFISAIITLEAFLFARFQDLTITNISSNIFLIANALLLFLIIFFLIVKSASNFRLLNSVIINSSMALLLIIIFNVINNEQITVITNAIIFLVFITLNIKNIKHIE